MLDEYETSSLARVDGDSKVYALTPNDDAGSKSWINVTAEEFIDGANSDPDSIYTINSVDAGTYSAKADITTVAQLEDFYEDGTLPDEITDGTLKVSLSADTAESANIPLGVGVEFAKFNLTASDAGDVIVDSITLTAGGLDDTDNINDIAIYDEDGNRLNSSLKDVSSDEANVNLDDFIINAGETETITVKASVSYTTADPTNALAEGIYSLSIDSAEDINSDAVSVTGSFPVEGNEMNAVKATGLSILTFAQDGTSLSSVDLGDEAATLAKFKVSGSIADGTITRIALKKASTFTASVDAAENFELYADGEKVAEASEMDNKYIIFNIEDGVFVENGDTVKFVVKGDVVGGAGKIFAIGLDDLIDVEATGKKYPATIAGSFTAVSVSIEGGAVTLEKVDADSSKIKVDTDNVELGTINVTANSGEDVNIESLQLRISSSNDANYATSSAAFTGITNIEIYDATDKSTYDLEYVSGTGTKIYGNSDINIDMASGETHELIIRADTAVSSISDGKDYTVSMTAASDLVIKEVVDDTTLTDMTPSVVTLKKVTVEASGIDFTVKALSTSKTAVAGTEDLEAIKFAVEASAADVTITELQFANASGASTMDSSNVSGFALYSADGTLIDEVGTSALSGEEVTFDDLEIEIAADAIETFYVTLDLVSDSGNDGETLQLEISGYSAEDSDDDVYDTTNDSNTDGDIVAGTLQSARTISITGVGSLAVAVDNSLTATKYDIYAVAGTTPENLAALKLKATNEDIEITQIQVAITVATADNEDNLFSSFSLVDEDGVTVASSETVGALITFKNMSYVVTTGEEYLYLKGTLNLIGEDEVGVLNETNVTFKFKGIEANGYASSTELIPSSDSAGDQTSDIDSGEIAYDYDGDGFYDDVDDTTNETASSKKLGVLASKISSVEMVTSGAGYTVGSTLTSGEQIIGIIKVATDSSSNTTSTGTSVKTALSKIIVNITKLTDSTSGVGTAITSATIQNADSSSTQAAATGIDADADGSLSFTIADSLASDFEITPSSTEYFLVKATVSKGTGDDFVQAKLSTMDATDATANFAWTDAIGATSKSALRLSYSSVSGSTLSE
ncbi:MAG: hypothetical protein WC102_10410 [Saccharofermentanales bacterium]